MALDRIVEAIMGLFVVGIAVFIIFPAFSEVLGSSGLFLAGSVVLIVGGLLALWKAVTNL